MQTSKLFKFGGNSNNILLPRAILSFITVKQWY